jgi:hypothetical protein
VSLLLLLLPPALLLLLLLLLPLPSCLCHQLSVAFTHGEGCFS